MLIPNKLQWWIMKKRLRRVEGILIVSLSINDAGMREQWHGDTIVIHVNSSTAVLPRIAVADAVRKALIQIEAETKHVFQTIVTLRLEPYNITCLLLKCLNGYHHHINCPLYVTTTYLLFFVCFFMNCTLTRYVLLANWIKTHCIIVSCTLIKVLKRPYIKFSKKLDGHSQYHT
jgi:hypothetical protein